jgi:hypothetical protein
VYGKTCDVKLCNECLSESSFGALEGARTIVVAWRDDVIATSEVLR